MFYQVVTEFIKSMSLAKWFTKLTKGEPLGLANKNKATRKKPNWAVDENKYLNLSEVNRLRRFCQRSRNIGLKEQKHIHIRDWFMVELGLSCGLRVSEMANLMVGDLNLQAEEPSLVINNGKGSKARIVYFSSEFKKACLFFLNWKRKNNLPIEKESFIFTNKLGEQLSRRALQKSFKRCLKGTGLDTKYSIHCLRHTYGTHLYKSSGYNLRLVQQQLGHSSIRTTQVYADLLSDDIKTAVKKLYKQ